jgi:hypothetical protein
MAIGQIDRQWSRNLFPYLVVCAIPVGIYAAIFMPHFTYFVQYIRQALSPLWAFDGTLAQRLSFYLPFSNIDGLFGFWGRGFPAFVLLSVVFVATTLLKRIQRDDAVTLLALAAVAGAAYVPIVVSPTLWMGFGAVFAGGVLAIFLVAYRALKRSMARSYLLDWGLIALSLAFFHLPLREEYTPSSPHDVRQAGEVIERFVGDLAVSSAPDNPNIYFNYSPIPYFDFGIEFYLRTGRFPASMVMPLFAVAQAIRNGVQASEYVIVFEPGTPTGPEENKWQALTRSTAEIILKMSKRT